MLKLTAYRLPRAAQPLRSLWLALAFMFFTVQLGLPAHEASHPIGQADTACHFCMLGGHAPAMSNSVVPLKLTQFTVETPAVPADRPVLKTSVRTRYSRGPPYAVDA